MTIGEKVEAAERLLGREASVTGYQTFMTGMVVGLTHPKITLRTSLGDVEVALADAIAIEAVRR